MIKKYKITHAKYLRTVKIQNFKAIRDTGDVELSAFTLLIGRNGSPTNCNGNKDWSQNNKPSACSITCPNVCPKQYYKHHYGRISSAKNLLEDVRGINVSNIKSRSFRAFGGDFKKISGQL